MTCRVLMTNEVADGAVARLSRRAPARLRDVSGKPSLTVGLLPGLLHRLLPRASAPHWLATPFTDGFGRARVVASRKIIRHILCQQSLGRMLFALWLVNRLTPIERIGCGDVVHVASSAILRADRKSTTKLFTPVCARYQSTESTGAADTVKDLSNRLAGPFSLESRA
jgi:hypothetical protein